MERKIGEIFEYNGEWYQCVKDVTDDRCTECYFRHSCKPKCFGACSSENRQDKTPVCFKKLEKVGKPYMNFGRIVQRYKGVTIPVERPDEPYMIYYGGYHEIDIEIKNQEDMEENKLNLKPFDLEKAKAGKPVCTRDGRKARIICFDLKGRNHLIAAAVLGLNGIEGIETYLKNGAYRKDMESGIDLMMLPEKKEGWVNVFNHGNNDAYVGNMIYRTKELAENAALQMNGVKYIATVKIEWEE